MSNDWKLLLFLVTVGSVMSFGKFSLMIFRFLIFTEDCADQILFLKHGRCAKTFPQSCYFHGSYHVLVENFNKYLIPQEGSFKKLQKWELRNLVS